MDDPEVVRLGQRLAALAEIFITAAAASGQSVDGSPDALAIQEIHRHEQQTLSGLAEVDQADVLGCCSFEQALARDERPTHGILRDLRVQDLDGHDAIDRKLPRP